MTKAISVLALVACLALPAPVWAASTRSILAQSGFAGQTCASFTHLSPAQRDRLVRSANRSTPVFLSSPEITDRHGHVISGDSNAVPGTPLDAGAIISACQAASPSSTISEAYSRANSTGVYRLR